MPIGRGYAPFSGMESPIFGGNLPAPPPAPQQQPSRIPGLDDLFALLAKPWTGMAMPEFNSQWNKSTQRGLYQLPNQLANAGAYGLALGRGFGAQEGLMYGDTDVDSAKEMIRTPGETELNMLNWASQREANMPESIRKPERYQNVWENPGLLFNPAFHAATIPEGVISSLPAMAGMLTGSPALGALWAFGMGGGMEAGGTYAQQVERGDPSAALKGLLTHGGVGALEAVTPNFRNPFAAALMEQITEQAEEPMQAAITGDDIGQAFRQSFDMGFGPGVGGFGMATASEILHNTQLEKQAAEIRARETRRGQVDLGRQISQINRGMGLSPAGPQFNQHQMPASPPSFQYPAGQEMGAPAQAVATRLRAAMPDPFAVDDIFQLLEDPTFEAAYEEMARYEPSEIIDTPERQELRQSLVKDLYGQGAPVKERQAMIILGPPASGKSTLAESIAEQMGALIVDPDLAKERLPGFNNGIGANAVHEESKGVSRQVFVEAVLNGDNMIYPMVGKEAGKVREHIEKLRENGYNVGVRLVTIPVEDTLRRAVSRYKEKGRYVRPDYILDEVSYHPTEVYLDLVNSQEVEDYEAFFNDTGQGNPPRRAGVAEVEDFLRQEVERSDVRSRRYAGRGVGGDIPSPEFNRQEVASRQFAPDIPNVKTTKSGRYYGAPQENMGDAEIGQLVDRLSSMAVSDMALPQESRSWYQRGGTMIKNLTRGNMNEADHMARIAALMSADTGIGTNVSALVDAAEKFVYGQDFETGYGRYPNAKKEHLNAAIKAKEFTKALPGVSDKVLSFYRNLRSEIAPVPEWENEVTLDKQMFRAFGYPAKTEVFTGQKYGFGREIMSRVADRVSQLTGEKIKPREAQAMIWTAIRNEQKMDKMGERFPGPSNDGFETYMDRHAAVAPFEAVPHPTVGSFPAEVWEGMAPEQQRDFTSKAADLLNDERGNNILLEAIGAPALYQTTEGSGTFEGDLNPNEVTYMVLPRKDAQSAKRMADAYAASIGYIYKQKAAAWWQAMSPGAVKLADSMPGFHLVVQSGSITPAQMKTLAEGRGLDFTYFTRPDGRPEFTFIDFDGMGQNNKALEAKLHDLVAAAGDVTLKADPFRAVGNYIENNWEADPDGQTYRQKIAESGFGDLQARADGLRAKFDALEQETLRRVQGPQFNQQARPPVLTAKDYSSLPLRERNHVLPYERSDAFEKAWVDQIHGDLTKAGLAPEVVGAKLSLLRGLDVLGRYVPESNLITINEKLIKFFDMEPAAIAVHEMHHRLDNLADPGNGDSVFSAASPLFFGQEVDLKADTMLDRLLNTGPVAKEMIDLWKSGDTDLQVTLDYPMDKFDIMQDIAEAVQNSATDSELVKHMQNFKAWRRYFASELFAQAGMLYHRYPNFKGLAPRTAQLVEEVKNAAFREGSPDVRGVRDAFGADRSISLRSGARGPDFNNQEVTRDRGSAEWDLAGSIQPTGSGYGGSTSPPGSGGGPQGSGPTNGPEGGYNIGRASGEVIAGNLNLDKFDLSPEEDQIIQNMAEAMGKDIEKARRGTVTWDEAQMAALDQIASDINVPLGKLLNRQMGRVPNVEELFQFRTILKAQTQRVHQAAQKAHESGTHQDLMDLRAELGKLAAVQTPIMGDIAELGRAFGSLKAMVGETKNAQVALDLAFHGRDPAEVAERLAALKEGEIPQMARKLADPTAWDKFMEIWINALLSGPTTHAVNISSNFIYALQEQINTYAGALISEARGDRGALAAANARMAGMIEGGWEGLKLAYRAFKTEEPSDPSQKIEAKRYKAIRGLKGQLVRVPGRALMAEDEFFKAIAYRAELASLSHETAYEEGLTPGTEEYLQRVKDLKMDPSEQLHEKAKDRAAKLTFTKPLGSYGRSVQKAVQKGPVRLVVPFFRTPVNIVKSSFENSPLAVALPEARNDLMGRNGQRAQNLQAAKIMTGTAIGAMVVALAAQGLITGAGPEDPREKGLLYATGWQPYSIKIGGRWYRYSRLEPMGMLLGVSADLAETAKAGKGGAEGDEIAAMLVGSITRNLTDKTWLRGISEVIEVLDDPQRYGERYIQNLLGTVVPTGVAQISRVNDPLLREAGSIIDNIRSRAGFGGDLPLRYDIFGQPIDTGASVGNLFSPVKSVPVEDANPVAEEMLRLNVIKGRPGRVLHSVKLDDRMYSKYTQYVGQIMDRQMRPLVNSPQYRALNDRARAMILEKMWDKVYSDARDAFYYRNFEEISRAAQ